jgi:hypothetical protein
MAAVSACSCCEWVEMKSLRKRPQKRLKDKLLERLVHPAVDHEYLAEVSEVGSRSGKRHAVAIVRPHFAIFYDARHWHAFDEQVERIGDDLPKPPGKVVRLSVQGKPIQDDYISNCSQVSSISFQNPSGA